MAEFAYNNGYQESIKRTPFFANYGVNPEYQTIRHLMQGKTTPAENMSELHDTLQAEMTEAQLRHKEYYEAGRKPDPNLQLGDMVWLLPRNLRTTRPCKKLDYKKIGPFKILAKIGESAYKLDLPPTMRIHNTFHISLLELHHDDKFSSQRTQPPPPIIIEGEPEYELEQIIDSRLHYGKLQYRPSGPVILLNTTKSGTPTKISKMQALQNNNSTKSIPGSSLSIKIEEQEKGETWVSITPPPQLAPPPPPPRMTTPRPPIPKTAQEGWETAVGLPTSSPYRAPPEWEQAEKKERARKEHDVLSWTACYDDGCQVHYKDKEASEWFPQDRSRSVPSVPVSHRNKKQQRKRHGLSVTWYECYDDKCFVHGQEKIKAGVTIVTK